jgi:hypothetical protein
MAGRTKTLAILSLLSATTGCAGFTPLYADPGLAGGLRDIAVTTPNSRTGYLLRKDLEDDLGVSKGEAPRYRLVIGIVERRRPRGLNPDDTPTRYENRLDVNYTLTDGSGKVLLQRSRPVFFSANAVIQPYATIATQLDSEERLARQAALLIRTDVTIALARK